MASGCVPTEILEVSLRGILLRLVFLFLLIPWIAPVSATESVPPIQFGLTAVVVTENLRLLDRWSQYMEHKTGRKVEFVLRKSYREVMDLLNSGGIDFAWICGYPFVQPREPEFLQLLTVPIYRGKPRYHSYIIVHYDSPYKRLSDLRGRVFAFSDPDSNSGFLYPLALLSEQKENPETFFRQTFFTFNHAETIQAVAEQVADGGAVDSYIWEYLAAFRPEITKKTRIIKTSPSFGFPPLVSRIGVELATVKLMKQVLEKMKQDPEGKSLLADLKLDGFGDYPPSLFYDIRKMAKQTRKVVSRSSPAAAN